MRNKWKAKLKQRVLTSTWLQILLLHVVVSQRTTKNCIKMKNARAGRVQFADVTVVHIKYADLWCLRCRCHCASYLTGWCLRIDDRNATNQELDWLSKEKWACYTCGTHLRIIPCRPITCYLNMWKDHRCYGYIIESLRSTTWWQRQRNKFCIFNKPKQKLCTPFMCFFYFCTFLSRSRQICDLKWPCLKFYRECEHTAVNLNFLG